MREMTSYDIWVCPAPRTGEDGFLHSRASTFTRFWCEGDDPQD